MGLRLVPRAAVLGAASVVMRPAWEILTPAPALDTGARVVEIPAHQGVLTIATTLVDAGVVRSRVGFVALTLARGSSRRLQAGEYEVERATDTLGVLRLLETGRVKQHVVLHPEGATVTELAGELERDRIASAAAIIRIAHDPAFLRELGIPGPSVEGYLFPDTYQFVRGMTPDEVLTRMVQRLRTKLTPDMLARARRRGLGIHGLLTLASIIEREAVARDETRLISAVFWHRLNLDMPRQADPRRPPRRPSLQHLPPRGAPAGADREPGPRGDRGCARSRAGEVPLLRRDERSPPLLLDDSRAAQGRGRPLPARPQSVNVL